MFRNRDARRAERVVFRILAGGGEAKVMPANRRRSRSARLFVAERNSLVAGRSMLLTVRGESGRVTYARRRRLRAFMKSAFFASAAKWQKW